MPIDLHPISDRPQGVATEHIQGILDVCARRNLFLFIRPTEFDSIRLIREGFATKSMDIHDKSSNWGPMAGCVPCDPAFSKNREGAPKADLKPHAHGEAKPVQLVLSSALKQALLPSPGLGYELWQDLRDAFKPVTNAQDLLNPPRSRVHVMKDQSIRFVLVEETSGEWKVWWVHETPGRSPALIPLWVWGYTVRGGVKPVTGDYDIWLVAPQVTSRGEHRGGRLYTDSHGRSAATPFIQSILPELNRAVQREDNPVFNHGAEQHNHGFLQKLDTQLAMFTPGGVSGMVPMPVVPQVLGEIQHFGYVVYPNRWWLEDHPLFGNSVNVIPEVDIDRAIKARQRILRALREFRARKGTAQGTGWEFLRSVVHYAKDSSPARVDWRSRTQKLAKTHVPETFERTRMLIFAKDFEVASLHMKGVPPAVLPSGAYPEGARGADQNAARILADLSRAVTRAQQGEGDSDKALDIWLKDHDQELGELYDFWAWVELNEEI
jgi:hypothetical protein